MALLHSSVPLRVPLRSPPRSSIPNVPDPESNLPRAGNPTVPCLLATVVTDPLFESAAASALVADLVDFVAAYGLDYATSLVAGSESDCPSSVGGECALGTDVLEDRQEDFECLAASVPDLVAMLLAPEGDPVAPDIPTPRSYAQVITPPYSSPVKQPPGSPPVFKARYVARGFSQRQGVDFFQTFSPTPKMTTLRDLLHVAAQRDYELHSLDFSTASYRAVCTRRSGCAAHLASLGCFLQVPSGASGGQSTVSARSFSNLASSTPRHSPLLCLPVIRSRLHLRMSPTSGMGLVLGGRGPVVLTGHADASW
ncbi:unnamed protein product, partial [Closterium sp. NIES-53]